MRKKIKITPVLQSLYAILLIISILLTGSPASYVLAQNARSSTTPKQPARTVTASQYQSGSNGTIFTSNQKYEPDIQDLNNNSDEPYRFKTQFKDGPEISFFDKTQNKRSVKFQDTKNDHILSFLNELKAERERNPGNMSEVFTDRLSAVNEIITPHVITDLLTAKRIHADTIEGLEIFTNRISSLEGQIAGVASAFLADAVRTAVASVKPTGFTIVLDQAVPKDMEYNWIAISVKDPRRVVGKSIDGSPQVTTVVTPVPSPSPTVSEETPVSTPSAIVTESPEASASAQ